MFNKFAFFVGCVAIGNFALEVARKSVPHVNKILQDLDVPDDARPTPSSTPAPSTSESYW